MQLEHHRDATYEDLMAVPEHLVAEILNGRLVTHPRPAPRHASASAALGMIVGHPYQLGRDGPGGWVFMVEPELHLDRHVAVPDLAGWRRERLSAFPETAWIETVPDWICEVLSPGTERHDRGEKRAIYAAAGVPHLWLVNPVLKLLEVHALQAGTWQIVRTFVDGDSVSVPPFDAISFDLSDLWPLSG